MEWSGGSARVYDWLWFLVWGIASTVWCCSAAGQLGATFDEPLYVSRGLERWRTGSYQKLLKVGTMPLPADVETLPLYLWQRWHGISLDPSGDLERVLPWARAGNLVFWWLLLAYGLLAGRQLAGPWGGRLAVALLACEPSLLAHASLATTDIAVTACLLALVYHFRTGRDARWFRRVALPALWFAAAVLAKASGLVFGVLCLCAVEIERRLRMGDDGGGAAAPAVLRPLLALRSDSFRRDMRQIVLGGLVLTLAYCGSDWRSEPSFVAWAHGLPEGPGKQVSVWVAEHLGIFSNAGEGLVRQVRHNVHAHRMFLLGDVGNPTVWYYFPVALSIKLSLPLLALPLVVALVRRKALLNWACLAALTLLAFSVTYRVQIGVRLVLPLVALGIVGLAGSAVQAAAAWSEAGGEIPNAAGLPYWHLGARKLRRVAATAFLAACVVWIAAASVHVWPHALCYTNELWGGTQRGYLRLSDSNYDWGQGLKELANWQRQNGMAPLAVWYFGTDPVADKLPIRMIRSTALPWESAELFQEQFRGQYLAVSTSVLYGGYTDNGAQSIVFLRAQQPAARTTTFLIYNFTGQSKALLAERKTR